MNLLIVSHTPHYRQAGKLVGWGPTIREIDHLASLYDSVIHLAVQYDVPAPPSSLGYSAPNVRFVGVAPAGGNRWIQKPGVLWAYPGYLKKIHEIISGLDEFDCVHVRCPANLAFLAVSWLAVYPKPKYRWVKYAGNWQPVSIEPFSYRLQRKLLEKNLHRGIVTVNGKWQNQPQHVLSFYNPCLSIGELQAASIETRKKEFNSPVQILFVGGLSHTKGAGRALEIAAQVHTNGGRIVLHMVGDGPDRARYESWVRDRHLESIIKFYGWIPRSELDVLYRQGHINLLPSASEGWPKVLSEGMAYGVVPIAGAVSSIPQILGECHTGRAVDYRDIKAFVQEIEFYLNQPDQWKYESQAGMDAAQLFTYEYYLAQLTSSFEKFLGVHL